MKGQRNITLAFAALLSVGLHAQHTPLTTQYLFNGLLINPAYAGSRDALTANLTYRQQWVGFEGAPTTQILSVHSPVNGKHIGLGLMVYNDRIGVSRETGVMTNYASVSYTHLRAHETVLDLVCRLLLEKKKNKEIIFLIPHKIKRYHSFVIKQLYQM